MRVGGLVTAGVMAALAWPGAAAAQSLSFTTPQKLPEFSGGEPSIAFDPNGNGDLYLTAPQAVPSAAGAPFGGPFKGIGFWGSHDGGRTFPEVLNTGSATGGGDSDVEVANDHTVFAADLEATSAAICISHDEGRSFPNCDIAFTRNQQGPDNDREWLTHGPKGELYLTYHDFAAGFPLIFKSTDGGQSFSPCGTIIDSNGPAAKTYSPQGGTLVSKPVVGPDGTIYVEFSTPDQNAPPVGAAIDNLYVAVAPHGCNGSTTFTDHVIYQDPGADLGKIFQAEGMDGGGNLYVVAAGMTKAGQKTTNLWLFVSRDGGAHWAAPIQVNPPGLQSNVLPWVAGGRAGDEAVIGWFGSSVSGDPNDAKNVWNYYAATTFDGGESFTYDTVTPSPAHYQDICTQGTLCGLIPGQPGNRNLLDFSGVAVDPATGCAALAIPEDPENNNPNDSQPSDNFTSHAFVALQNGGPSLSPSGAPCGTPPGAPAHPSPTPLTTTNQVCGDRIAPRTSISGHRVRATRRRVSLRGRTIDRVCTTGAATSAFRGKVARVTVSVAHKLRRGGCQFLTARGRLSRARSCRRTIELPAKTRFIGGSTNKTSWTFSRRVKLPPGRYIISARGTDAVGHVERRLQRHNTLKLQIR